MGAEFSYSFQEGQWLEGTPYRVVRPLGAGGMGEVYEVDHTRTGTRRAVKVARKHADAPMSRRLLREARALRLIEHPNVVRVYEAGMLSGERPYFSMELLEGMSLRTVIAEQAPMMHERAVRLMLQVLDGLSAIQARHLVHRDIKPSNLFLDHRGVVKVLDLGIVKSIQPTLSQSLTKEGMVLGTTKYMAPEQLMGVPVDARADVFAAGLVLAELLIGRKGRKEIWRRCESEDGFGDAPPGLVSAIRRAVARDPTLRFSSAQQMATALRVWVPAPPIPMPRQKTRVAFCLSTACKQPDPRREPSCRSLRIVHHAGWLWGIQIGILALALTAMVLATTVAWKSTRQPSLDTSGPAACSVLLERP